MQMKITSDPEERYPAIPQISPAGMIQYQIREICRLVPADVVCACNYRRDQDVIDMIAHVDSQGEEVRLQSGPRAILQGLMRQLPVAGEPCLFAADDLDGTGFESALVFPLSLPGEMIGVLALLAHQPQAFKLVDADLITLPLNTIRMVIENLYLYEALAHSLVVSHSIVITAQTLAENPSPQHIIDVLANHLFDMHVTSCAIMLYGPVREDRPLGPFDYLEMKGSWSKQRGSGIALGTKIYLRDYPDILAELDKHRPLVMENVRQLRHQFDPFTWSLLRAERIVSLTILPLHAGQRKLGVLLVGTNKRHKFAAAELDTYRAVSESMAISAMSQLLQQQHDLVQQGRSALLEAVTDGVVMVLPDASGGRVLTVNKRFAWLFGLSKAAVEGLLLEQVIRQMPVPESTRRELQQTWLGLDVRDPATQSGEFNMIHSDGVRLDIEWYSAPVYQDANPEGQVMGRIYIVHDVTPERTARRLRSAFLSRISHELRTPLQAIQGYAEMNLEFYADQMPDRARNNTAVIMDTAKNLNNIFNDMIEMTRADSGELKLQMAEMRLSNTIISVVARLRPLIDERGQRVVMNLDDRLPPVWGDTTRIEQVMTNLLRNANKYAPPGSHIYITTTAIPDAAALPTSAPADSPLPAVLVTVVDEGEGLTPEDAERIFIPFFRTEQARTQKVEGVGLGLAVVRTIIELHRGQIWAEPATKEHPGARFMFLLPLAPHPVMSEAG